MNNRNFRAPLMLVFVLTMVTMAVQPSAAKITRTSRMTNSFDSNWLFFKGDPSSAEKADFVDAAWRKLDVPHDWSIEGPFDAKNPTGGAGGFLPAGVGWYRKHFLVLSQSKDRRFFIE